MASLYAFLAQSKHFRARTRLKLRQASRRDHAENARLGQEAGPGQEIEDGARAKAKSASSEEAVPFAAGQVAAGANEPLGGGGQVARGIDPGLADAALSD